MCSLDGKGSLYVIIKKFHQDNPYMGSKANFHYILTDPRKYKDNFNREQDIIKLGFSSNLYEAPLLANRIAEAPLFLPVDKPRELCVTTWGP